MFRQSISSTPFTSEAADAVFENIKGEPYRGDITFLATLRALIAPRIPETDSIYVEFHRSSYTSENVGATPKSHIIKAMCDDYMGLERTGMIMIHSLGADQIGNIACLKVIEDKFTTQYPSYRRLEKMRDFFRKSFAVDCFYDADAKNVIVFVDSLDLKKYHYLQTSILAILPWYFDPKAGTSELEMELIFSLREPTPDKYLDCLRRLAAQYDFRSASIRRMLKGFETKYEREECNRMRAEIENKTDRLNELNTMFGQVLREKEEACIRLMGLEQKLSTASEDSEIMDYFLCNQRLTLINVGERDMHFVVKDYLSYFDSEIAERILSNPDSFVYIKRDGRSRQGDFTKEQAKRLLWEIFVSEEPRLRIKFCAAYKFKLSGCVEALSGYTFPAECCDAMPNPHIDRFSCMGNYSLTVNELLQRHDYIGAIEQCVASCKSLNWGDSPVMGEFMEQFWRKSTTDGGKNICCIELPDGRVVKPAEAAKWLDEQDGIGETDEQTEET